MILYHSASIILVAFGDITTLYLETKTGPIHRIYGYLLECANKKCVFINGAVSQFCDFTNDENSLKKKDKRCKTGSRLSYFMRDATSVSFTFFYSSLS